ncbi:hypothetical protein [Kerstersia similis]|uniref:hypothetical protein n=1 Tax=Kerstersia similis TaxID=206505 RepID=UPI0039F111E1
MTSRPARKSRKKHRICRKNRHSSQPDQKPEGERYPYPDSNHYPKSPQDRKNILLPRTNTNKSAPQKKAAHLFTRTSMAHAPNPIPHHSAMHQNFPKPHQAHSDRKQIKIIIKNKSDIEKQKYP